MPLSVGFVMLHVVSSLLAQAGVLCSTICTCLQCSNTGPPNSHVTSLGLSPSACGGPELLKRCTNFTL